MTHSLRQFAAMASFSLSLATLAVGCEWSKKPPPVERVQRAFAYVKIRAANLQDRAGLDPERIHVSPIEFVLAVHWQPPDLVVIEYDRNKYSRARSLRVHHPEACPTSFDALSADTPERAAVLTPVVRTPNPVAQLGYDRPFEIGIEPACDRSSTGTIRWDFSRAQGFSPTLTTRQWTFRGRTPAFDPSTVAAQTVGIVPRSPRTQGFGEFIATITLRNGTVLTRTVTVSAIGRATGVPSVSPNHTFLLAGGPWSLVQKPPGATATIVPGPSENIQAWTPDLAGPWLFRNTSNRFIRIGVGAAEDMPLDCGRPGCHENESAAWERNPMADVFYRSVEGIGAAKTNPNCALRCHTTGEPGIEDSGFWAVARLLRTAVPAQGHTHTWEQLPRSIHHLSNVGCTSCHGSGILPSPDSRWTLLSSDVCAHCHDAPPNYAQVTQWRASAMAQSDHDPRTRTAPCAQCHSTHDFLAAQGFRTMAAAPPVERQTLGISCSACHATHSASGGRSLREVSLRPWMVTALSAPATTTVTTVGVQSQACVYCHSPTTREGAPEASSAAIWMGIGGVQPRTGEPLRAAHNPHRANVECISCHRGASAADGEGPAPSDPARFIHGFASNASTCSACHQREIPVDSQSIMTRARALLQRIRTNAIQGTDVPPHSVTGTAVTRSQTLQRAERNVLLVIEDRGAWAHNPSYARALLDAAEAGLTPVIR